VENDHLKRSSGGLEFTKVQRGKAEIKIMIRIVRILVYQLPEIKYIPQKPLLIFRIQRHFRTFLTQHPGGHKYTGIVCKRYRYNQA